MNSHKKFLILLILTLLLTGCVAGEAQSPPATPPAAYTALPDTPAAAPTEEPTATLPPTPTWTPLPTLSPEEAQAKVLELLETNGGCELPCWWGLNPGISSWDSVIALYSQFGIKLPRPKNQNITTDYSFRIFYPNYGRFNIVFGVKELKYRNIIINISEFNETAEIKELINQYSLESVVAQNGEPSRVYFGIRLALADPGGPNRPYQIWVIYDHLGILVHYSGFFQPSEAHHDGVFSICPTYESLDNIVLFLQSPDDYLSLDYLEEKFHGKLNIEARLLSGEIVPLQEATELSLSDFHEIFSNPNNETCLETAEGLWR